MSGKLPSANYTFGDLMLNIWHKNLFNSLYTPGSNSALEVQLLLIYCKNIARSRDDMITWLGDWVLLMSFFTWHGDPPLSCRLVYHGSSFHLHLRAPCQRSSGRLRALLRPGLDFVRLLLHPRRHLPRPAEEERVTRRGGREVSDCVSSLDLG